MGVWRAVLVIGLMVLVSGGSVAFAHHNGHEFETAEECMASGTFDRMPSCNKIGNGPWIAQYGDSFGTGSPGMPGWFGGLLVFGLLWSAAPAVIGGFIAADRGQSVGLAVLLGIVFGWIGLAIVAFAFKPEVASAARNVVDAAARPDGSFDRPRHDARSRLQQIEELRRQQLITDEEYTTRRTAILDEI